MSLNFEDIVQRLSCGVVLLDKKGFFQYANGKALALLQAEGGKLTPESWESCLTEDSKMLLKRLLDLMPDGGGKDKRFSLSFVKQELSSLETRLSSVGEGTFMLEFYSPNGKDDLGADLRKSEECVDEFFSQSPDALLILDKQGEILKAGKVVVNLFGYRQEELTGLRLGRLVVDLPTFAELLSTQSFRAPLPGKTGSKGLECRCLKKNGETFPAWLRVAELQESGRYLVILRDLSETKVSLERLRRFEAALERANHDMEEFAYVSSHDLQEPLRKIRIFGERISSHSGNLLDAKSSDYLRRMLSASGRMQDLINALLSFSRVSARSASLEVVDLNKVLEHVVSDLEIPIEGQSAEVEVGELPFVEGIPSMLRQLFQNLLANAIKFRKTDERPRVEVFVSKNSEEEKDQVEICVRDNGIGFDPAYANKVFQIFQRLEGNRFEGSGVGLAICKKIASIHGGEIKAESKEGVGTTITVTLSVKQV
ncbi:hypothetical protein FUAX_15690 [Fulvitalea axinellae]|uniref:histidine kinase n=1 Tax=Fulvitalea axinellae TaxID=1182444 RepID=A0AAU9CQA6_9BACT|nr:hypothetical protein FUAX_15690 [Fulvitalea axinellae]